MTRKQLAVVLGFLALVGTQVSFVVLENWEVARGSLKRGRTPRKGIFELMSDSAAESHQYGVYFDLADIALFLVLLSFLLAVFWALLKK